MAKPRDDRLVAHLVYDGGSPTVNIPETLGGAEQQPIVGSPLEQLAEFAAFISHPIDHGEFLHIHRALIDQGRLAPYRHATFGVVVPAESEDTAYRWAGMLFGHSDLGGRVAGSSLRITATLRSMIRGLGDSRLWDTPIPSALASAALAAAPQFPWTETAMTSAIDQLRSDPAATPAAPLIPEYPDERWVSIYMQAGASVLAHVVQLVERGAVALRTAEFDDSGMSWIISPLLKDYLRATQVQQREAFESLDSRIQDFAVRSQRLYDDIVARLEQHARSSARARVAAAGFLGQCVRSEVLVTTTVFEWQRILRAFGDFRVPADVRHLVVGKREGEASVFDALMHSRYRESFLGAKPRQSADGIGRVMDVPPDWAR